MNSIKQLIPLLSVEMVTKQFAYKQVLKGVNFDLFENQILLLIGRNGAGKSTLVKILSGLMRASSGAVKFRGKPIGEQANRYRQSFAMITHDLQFYEDLTARENLLFYNSLYKKNNTNAEIDSIIEKVNLTTAADVGVGTFSSGMRKRLNIARLMLIKPKLLFLDEPYSGLDFESVVSFNTYLEEFKNDGGAAIIISHQMEASAKICDKAILLEKGKISEIEKPEMLQSGKQDFLSQALSTIKEINATR